MPDRQSFSTTGQRVGLAAVGSAGLASAMSTSTLLSYIVWHTFFTSEKNTPFHRGIRSFTCSSLGCYLASLLFCDFMQGIAFSLNYKWAVAGLMVEGNVCTIQGAVSQVGDLGAAIWSIAIGIHTFSLLFLVRKPYRLLAPIILVLGWTMLILLPILGPTVIQTSKRGSFYGLSGAWCWIGTGYSIERLAYLYIWVFTALGFSFIVYTLIYLRFSNILVVSTDGALTLNFRRQQPNTRPVSAISTSQIESRASRILPGCFDWGKDPYEATSMSGTGSGSNQITRLPGHVSTELRHIARRLMWYPILYTVVVVPVAVCRMGVLAGWQPPFGLLVFAGICFGGSGVSNVVLFLTTRHAFIRNVALSRAVPRVLVTTQRVTVREETASNCVELDGIESDASIRSHPTPKSCLANFEDAGVYTGDVTVEMSEVCQVQNSSRTEITVDH